MKVSVSASFAFVAENAATLRRTKVLPVVPGPGVVDGTFAVGAEGAGGTPNTGFVFLFNPTTRAASPAAGLLAADDRLGIRCAGPSEVFVIGQVWPTVIPTLTTVACGANFSVSLEARNALVLLGTSLFQLIILYALLRRQLRTRGI